MINVSNPVMVASAANLGAIDAELAAASAATTAAGSAVTPPGSEGASMLATAQQRESLAMFIAYMETGLAEIAGIQGHTLASDAKFATADAASGADVAATII